MRRLRIDSFERGQTLKSRITEIITEALNERQPGPIDGIAVRVDQPSASLSLRPRSESRRPEGDSRAPVGADRVAEAKDSHRKTLTAEQFAALSNSDKDRARREGKAPF